MILTKTKKIVSLPKLMAKKYKYIIGIDTGVNTGYVIWDVDNKKFTLITDFKIHHAMDNIRDAKSKKINFLIRVEDARKRKWFGNAGREQLQGAGSIKRDAKIWEDFLTELGVDYEMVAPKNNKTKLDADTFKMITGWTKATSQHARDAAMLVYGF